MRDWYERQTLGLLPERAARRWGTREGLAFQGTRWTFAELDAAVEQAVGWLDGLGIGPNDRVATLLRNGAWPVVVLHSLIRLGAVLVPLNTRLTIPELVWQLTNCGARFLIADEPNAEKATIAAATVSGVAGVFVPPLAAGSSFGLDVQAQARAEPPRQVDLPALHSIVYTSGTTGRPKGCVHTHRSVQTTAFATPMWSGSLAPGRRILSVLPYFHVTGMTGDMNATLAAGSTIVMMSRWDPVTALTLIEPYGVFLL